MDINSLIEKRLLTESFNIYDPKGKKVDHIKVKEDFLKLTSWLRSQKPHGVAINLPKDHRYLISILACMVSNVFYVPTKNNYPQHRLQQIQEETEFELLLTEDKFNEILNRSKAEPFHTVEPDQEAVLYKICTSGSTGKPKAVVVQRKALAHFWQWVTTYFTKVKNQERLLQVTDFTFDISLIDVALFLSQKVDLYFSEFTGNIFTLAFEVETHKIQVLNTVVNNVNMLLDDKVVTRLNYNHLHTVMMGGARFSYGLYKKCENHLKPKNIDVHNLYGVTEVPVYSHCKTMNFNSTDLLETTVSVGKPLGACTAIIYKDGKIQAPNEKGEVLLGGGSLMKGYAKDPEKTASVFCEVEGRKYYRTGDIGHITKSGDFFVTGRMDDTIKYRGFRINLLDIDSYILKLDYVQDCVTVAIANEETQNTTVCYVLAKKEVQEKEFKKELSVMLLDYQIPEKIFFVHSFPTNDNGKVCKKTLRQNYINSQKEA